MSLNQIGNNTQINQSLFNEKDQAVENKVKSIVSQLPGKIRNISFKYNKSSVAKAKITIVVSSEEEAVKVKQNIDDEIDIKVIIHETLEDEATSSKLKLNSNQETYNTRENKENDDKNLNAIEQNIYSFNRGPDGKIYGIIKEKKENPIESYPDFSKDSSINDHLKNKYINIYKRYNFKNIKIEETHENSRFSMNI